MDTRITIRENHIKELESAGQQVLDKMKSLESERDELVKANKGLCVEMDDTTGRLAIEETTKATALKEKLMPRLLWINSSRSSFLRKLGFRK